MKKNELITILSEYLQANCSINFAIEEGRNKRFLNFVFVCDVISGNDYKDFINKVDSAILKFGYVPHLEGKSISDSRLRLNLLLFESQEIKLKYENEKKLFNHLAVGETSSLFFYDKNSTTPFLFNRGIRLIHNLKKLVLDLALKECKHEQLISPEIYTRKMWEETGHLSKYADSMFLISDDKLLKPMSCPAALTYCKKRQYTKIDLPIRIFEFGRVFRKEQSGEQSSLKRTNAFTQDDRHIIVLRSQVSTELSNLFTQMLGNKDKLGLYRLLFGKDLVNVRFKLSTRPEKYIGDLNDWDFVTKLLQTELESRSIPYEIETGEGAFYGPKIDVAVIDHFGIEWQLGTLQLDFNIIDRLKVTKFMSYRADDEKCYVIHAAICGSIERFLAILLEERLGILPFELDKGLVVLDLSSNNNKLEELTTMLNSCDITIDKSFKHEHISKAIKYCYLNGYERLIIINSEKNQECYTQKIIGRYSSQQIDYRELKDIRHAVCHESLQCRNGGMAK